MNGHSVPVLMVLTEFNDLTKLVHFLKRMLQVYNGEKDEYNTYKVELDSCLKTEGALVLLVNENDPNFGIMRISILLIFSIRQEWNAHGYPCKYPKHEQNWNKKQGIFSCLSIFYCLLFACLRWSTWKQPQKQEKQGAGNGAEIVTLQAEAARYKS